MKFATLGCDDMIPCVARWIKQQSAHDIVAVFDAGECGAELLALFPHAATGEGWESLLAGRDVDAVIVSARPHAPELQQARAEQLRRLVQEAVPMLLIHPVCEAIEAIELEMIRRDTNGVLVPLHPELHHPAFVELASIATDPAAELGPVEQVAMERSLVDRSAPFAIIDQFARDAVLLISLMGDIRQVSAMGGLGDELDFSNLSVNLRGAGSITGRWSVGPVHDEPKLCVSAVGTRGRATLDMPDDGTFRLTVLGSAIESPEFSSDDALAAAIDQLQDQFERGKGDENWSTACRALEAADAVLQSSRRGRAIDLLGEQPTEEDTFKAIMAAGGCGMLIWVLLVVVIDSLLLPARHRAVRLTILVLCPLVCFLTLQFLKLLFRKDRHEDLQS
jgi:predicted dehydrogenase